MPPKPIELTEPDADERYTQYRRVEGYFGSFADPATGIDLAPRSRSTRSPTTSGSGSSPTCERWSRRCSTATRPRQLPRTDAAPSSRWKGSPFPGLRSFTPADAPIFFGRGRETDLLASRVSSSPFVAVIGASGSGKSSIVGAGLIPRLSEADPPLVLPTVDPDTRQWDGLRLTPGELGPDPFLALAVHLAPLVHDVPRTLAARLRAHAGRGAGVPRDRRRDGRGTRLRRPVRRAVHRGGRGAP